ncbi:MAG: peptide deformylase [Vallitaleaceae bacterium]|jgi:peptide deformylase|nr:peptide deformylase [Vallitaleaceae bacterium]
MALRKIRIDDDPLLRMVSKKVKEVTPRIKVLVEDMFETMYKEQGVGLAAPQIGILKRIAVIDLYDDNKFVLINPIILETEGEQTGIEGCLSFPGRVGDVTRPNSVKVEATNLDGERYIIEGEGLLARALCHEIDHLDGIVFIEKAENLHDDDDINDDEDIDDNEDDDVDEF